MALEDLQTRRAKLKSNSDTTLENMQKLSNESYRVADVAHHAEQTLSDLDKEFAEATGLKGPDIPFLFIATGLQIVRYLGLNWVTHIEKAGSQNRNEKALHNFQQQLLGKFHASESTTERPYYASLEHIIMNPKVPYDATKPLSYDSLLDLQSKGHGWNYDIKSMIPSEKQSIFAGCSNHRFSTLGHDPILGLLFGTANIMTNTISCVQSPALGSIVEVPYLTTNHVVYTSDYLHPQIATYGSTAVMLLQAIERSREEPSALVAALIKQLIHIGTDLYTPCGIQIPTANLVLSKRDVEQLTKVISSGDCVKIEMSAYLASFINLLIKVAHNLLYKPSMRISREEYNVRTRKIILYSSIIAESSNVLMVACRSAAGDEYALKNLDIGGLILLMDRLMSDTEFIQQIKSEFIFGRFNKMIQGENLDLGVVSWDSNDF